MNRTNVGITVEDENVILAVLAIDRARSSEAQAVSYIITAITVGPRSQL